MDTLFARIVRFGCIGSVILTLVSVVALGVAIAVSAASTIPLTRTATTAARQQPVSISVAVTTAAQVLPTDPSHRPAADHEFIAVKVQLYNSGTTTQSYSIADFTLRDQRASTFDSDPDSAYLTGTAALPVHGTLGPVARRSGEIVFETPMSDHTAKLLWQPAGAAPGTVTQRTTSWNLLL